MADAGEAVGGGRAFTHLDEVGRARMVDVGDKEPTRRRAVARARIEMSTETTVALVGGTVAKGDVMAVARVAGIQAAKRTSELVPLCHPLMLSSVVVDLEVGESHVDVAALNSVLAGVELRVSVGASAPPKPGSTTVRKPSPCSA